MRDKNSFVLFYDIYDVVTALKAEQKGLLFQAILDYQITRKHEPTGDLVVDVAFIPIKQSLDRNNEKWEREKLARSEAGKKGMESRYNKAQQKITKPNKNNQSITKAEPKDNQTETKPEPVKEHYGENGHVLLTIEEYDHLCNKYGQAETEEAIKVLNNYIDGLEPAKKKAYLKKNHCRCMQNWCYDRVAEERHKRRDQNKGSADDYFKRVLGGAV